MKTFLITLLLFTALLSFAGDSKPRKITVTVTYTTQTLEEAAVLISKLSKVQSDSSEITITVLNGDGTTTTLKPMKSVKFKE